MRWKNVRSKKCLFVLCNTCWVRENKDKTIFLKHLIHLNRLTEDERKVKTFYCSAANLGLHPKYLQVKNTEN